MSARRRTRPSCASRASGASWSTSRSRDRRMTLCALERPGPFSSPARRAASARRRRAGSPHAGRALALVGLEPERLEALAAELGRPARVVRVRRHRPAASTRGRRHRRRFGPIDAVVANAGIANQGTVAVSPVDAEARTIEVNLIGVLRTVGADAPARDGAPRLLPAGGVGGGVRRAARDGRVRRVEGRASSTSARAAARGRAQGVGVGVAYLRGSTPTSSATCAPTSRQFDEMLRRSPARSARSLPVGECADALRRRHRAAAAHGVRAALARPARRAPAALHERPRRPHAAPARRAPPPTPRARRAGARPLLRRAQRGERRGGGSAPPRGASRRSAAGDDGAAGRS